MKQRITKGLLIGLATAALFLTSCEENEPADQAPIIEDLNAAQEELMQTEGKADGATCSGVRPPDNGPFNHKIAMTFDDGPNVTRTPQVLDILAAHGIKATFFINGKNVRSQAAWDVLAREVREGHNIGNHSQNHLNSKTVSAAKWQSEVDLTDQVIAKAYESSGKVPKFFRFPFGSSNCTTYGVVTEAGYHVVGWHIDSADWCFNSSRDGYGYCSPHTFRYVPDSYRGDFVGFSVYQAKANGGGILLMHDVHQFTVDHLDAVLTALEQAGFQFTTLDDVDTFPLLNGVTPQRSTWVGDPCEANEDCNFTSGDVPGFCYTYQDTDAGVVDGFCSLPCEGYCPDLDGAAPTFCVESADPSTGMCVSRAWPSNESCAKIPGSAATDADRFVGNSSASAKTSLVCLPK